MKTLAGALLGTTLLLGSCVSAVALVPPPPAAACAAPVVLSPDGLPVGAVAGYSGEQLANAAAIVTAGGAFGGPARAQLIAVMTA
ncbi:CHAP domain-containing protein, partial [Aquipuribacter hungaricus]